jgi:acetylornithine deacetylase/succinyl-diaminopimelate desuccinylase-like protein
MLCQLVDTESVTGNEMEIMLLLEELLRGECDNVKRLPMDDGRFNLLASKGSGRPTLCLNAHSDTVPPSGRSLPEARRERGLVRGLGSCDDKASLVAMIEAFSDLDEGEMEGRLDLLVSVDEEVSSRGVRTCVENGYRCDYAIVGEPTSLEAVIAHSGLIFLDLGTEGSGGHGSSPWKGTNAILAMVDFFRKLESEVSGFKDHPLVGKPSINLGVIQGGDTTNRIPESCEAKVDIRIMPGMKVDSALEPVFSLAEEDGVQLSVFKTGGPMETGRDSRLLAEVLRTERDILGEAPEPIGFRGWTEADPLRNQAGADVIVLGPGDVAQAHTPDEYVETSQIETASRIYLESARRLVGG